MRWFNRFRRKNEGAVAYDNDNGIEIHSHGPSPVAISFETDATELENAWATSTGMNKTQPQQGQFRRYIRGSTIKNSVQNAGYCSSVHSEDNICCGAEESVVETIQSPMPEVDETPFEDGRFQSSLLDGSWVGRERSNAVSLNDARGMTSIRDGKEKDCHDDDEKIENVGLSRKAYLLIGLLCVLVAVFIGSIVTLATRNKAEANQRSGNNSTSDENVQTDEFFIYTSSSALADETSPQAMALNWLTNTDELQMSLENGDSESQIKERFAAATLYFSTGGIAWTSNLGFLSGQSICVWNDGESLGIFCDDTGSVIEINIVENNLSGVLPNELNYFSSVGTLNLYYNKLTGKVPDLSHLIALEHLDVDGNMLSGTTPESLFNLPSIVTLNLLDNKNLTGTIPEIQSGSRLESLSLFECSFVGSLPLSLGSVSTLRLLQLKNNAITGTIPAGLFALPELETLGLHGNHFVGRLPVIPAINQSKLVSISLGGNQLEGPLPSGIGALTMLESFYAHENKLTGTIISELVELPALQHLWLYNNGFSDNIPDFSNSSAALAEVYLNGNDLSGRLETFLGTAPAFLERIDVSQNSRLQGYLSGDFGRFNQLKYFNASNCALTGGLPADSLLQLTQLNTLDISGNELSEQIPTTIGSMTDLNTLDLSTNAFTGYVPSEMGSLTLLTLLDLSKNQYLSGDLNQVICETLLGGGTSFVAVADCAGEAPVRVDCDCCTECCDNSGECFPMN